MKTLTIRNLMKYYVYLYLDKLTQPMTPIYVGKGNGDRKYLSKRKLKNNPFLCHKINKIGRNNVKTIFLYKSDDEQICFKKEKYWIKRIGRRDLGTGPLCNLTDGGEGSSGYKPTEEQLKHLSEINIGKHIGEKNTRAKLTETQVMDLRFLYSTGEYSLLDLAKLFKLARGSTHKIISGDLWKHLPLIKIDEDKKRKRIANGRRKCENHHNTSLTNKDVLRIRKTYSFRKNTTKMLAKEYNVSRSCIVKILRRDTFKEVKKSEICNRS